jgi:hypothetical protein
MQPNRTIFWVGLLMYAGSFCLIALGETKSSPGNQPLFGFSCALLAFASPLIQAKDALLHNVRIAFPPAVYLSLLISGWINPLFLIATFFKLTEHKPRAFTILRGIIVALIPICWVVAFYFFRTYPREGHFLWIIGMMLVLYSDEQMASLNS